MTPRITEHAPGVYEMPSLLGGSIRIAQWVVVGSDVHAPSKTASAAGRHLCMVFIRRY